MKTFTTRFLLGLLMLALSACGGISVPTADDSAIQTYTVQTAAVAATQTHLAASPTPEPSLTPTITESPEPSLTPTVEPTTSEPLSLTLTLTAMAPVTATLETPSSTVTPPDPDDEGTLLELDDFEHGLSWYTEDSDNYSFSYERGAYRIHNGLKPGLLFSSRSTSTGNVRLEVDAKALSEPEGSFWGLVCRLDEDGDYYALVVGPDGFVGIGKMSRGSFEFLDEDTANNGSDFDVDENGYVHIRADCVTSQLSLYVNGELLLQAEDTDIGAGKIGLVVKHGMTDEWLDVYFDNYALWRP